MAEAGLSSVHRDVILGRSLKGMDAYYIVLSDAALHSAMDKYTQLFDKQISDDFENAYETAHEEVAI